MARAIVVSLGGNESRFGFKKVSRKDLHGHRRRIAVDREGRDCKSASLTTDGALLLRSGMTAQGYFTDEDQWIPNKELVGLVDGEVVAAQPSTLGAAQALEEVGPAALFDLRVNTVYLLNAQELDPSLESALGEGKLFRMPFNYRADYHAETAILIQNGEGTFAIVGNPAEIAWTEPAATPPPVLEEEADDLGDDLDFDMF